jgi:hypothetical protein
MYPPRTPMSIKITVNGKGIENLAIRCLIAAPIINAVMIKKRPYK